MGSAFLNYSSNSFTTGFSKKIGTLFKLMIGGNRSTLFCKVLAQWWSTMRSVIKARPLSRKTPSQTTSGLSNMRTKLCSKERKSIFLDLAKVLDIWLYFQMSQGPLPVYLQNSQLTSPVSTKKRYRSAYKYWDILGKMQQMELDEKISQLKQLPFLKDWYENDLKTISYHFQPIKF